MEIEPTSSYSTADTNSGLVQTHIISSKQEIEQQALLLVQNYNVTIKSAKWVADRCEMILDSTEENVFLNAELLGKLHTELYETLSKESRFAELLETTEVRVFIYTDRSNMFC